MGLKFSLLIIQCHYVQLHLQFCRAHTHSAHCSCSNRHWTTINTSMVATTSIFPDQQWNSLTFPDNKLFPDFTWVSRKREPCIAYVCMFTKYFLDPVFMQIVCILNLPFQDKIFELSTLGSSYVIILQTATDRTNISIANTERCIWPFDWHINIWPWPVENSMAKGMHILTVNISHGVAYRANIVIANK